MSTIHCILCPIDFSELSMRAFAFADGFAQATGAELVLLHAFDTPETLDMAGQRRPANIDVSGRLERVSSSSTNVRVTRMLHAGPPGEVICWMAQERCCDLIIMGTHGRAGFKHLLLGSVAEYVLRHARCPVLTVKRVREDERPLREPTVLAVPPPRFM